MPERGRLQVGRYPAAAARAMSDELVDAHLDARAQLLDQPFYSAERFAERLAEHVTDPNFALVTGRVDGLLVGYAYGSSLPVDTWFWSRLDGIADPELTRETGSRTFWFRELLVRGRYQGQGYGHRLHDALLAGRPEERAVLFVRSDNPARLLYRRWGWARVGFLPAQPESPGFEAMLAPLPGTSGTAEG